MLFKFFSRFFERSKKKASLEDSKDTSVDKASELMHHGDLHGAITVFREHLKTDPYNIQVLNDLGVCLSDTGNTQEASATFELAYSLDDTFMPVVVNHAKLLNDRRKSTDALPFLQQAKICAPDFSHVDAVYAGICLNMGDSINARYFQLRAWLSNFDNLRLANCHLFYSAYNDMDEALLAAEHRFWAETVLPIELVVEDKPVPNITKFQKIRIGYWSPDFRNHSVRYFFRPLLENHDSSQFEIFLYHDFPKEDEQTALLRDACDHFHDVCELSDAALYSLVRSHQLDIIVELAGHSSNNRVTLLQKRFATVQISALGYPPTTGLQTVDAKLLDCHVVTSDSNRYYAESPLVLPTSFWCFNPMEDAVITPEPPLTRNGYVTFGCVGNIAKINARILRCWKAIFERTPNSRLLIRSISFGDPAAEDAMRQRLIETGIDLSRVDLHKPEAGAAFFGSYNEIDIVLDTFPFNGGTTTCFATYMGVPVVSLSGESLISRMGLSILSNLGEPGLAVGSADAYTMRAVALANDLAFLQRFRRQARMRFQNTSLGNGKLFALEFEDACKNLLQQKKLGSLQYRHEIALLPANEIVGRAYAVLRTGQTDAARRIVNHCLRHYPNSGNAHLFLTQLWNSERRFEEAVDYLQERLEGFNAEEKIAVLINMTRLNLLLDRKDHATQTVERLSQMCLDDTFDRMQVQLYRACLLSHADAPHPFESVGEQLRRVHVLIPCDSDERFQTMQAQIGGACWCPTGWLITFQRCDEIHRIGAYKVALCRDDIDILVVAQKNVEIHNSMFFVEIAGALENCDVLSVAGATRWQRMEWRADDFDCKSAGFLVASTEKMGFVEVQWLGTGSGRIVNGMAVLDGSLLALNPKRACAVEFDAEILGAELLLEEDWTHAAYRSGLRLAVHRNLGVLIDQQFALDACNRSAGRMRSAEKLGFDAFTISKDDHMLLSTPVASAADAVRVCRTFLEISA